MYMHIGHTHLVVTIRSLYIRANLILRSRVQCELRNWGDILRIFCIFEIILPRKDITICGYHYCTLVRPLVVDKEVLGLNIAYNTELVFLLSVA